MLFFMNHLAKDLYMTAFTSKVAGTSLCLNKINE